MSRTLVSLALALMTIAASAQTPLKVKMFPGAQALPALAAQSQGMFERQGLKVEILFTANSDEQRAGLAKGEFEIAQAELLQPLRELAVARADHLGEPEKHVAVQLELGGGHARHHTPDLGAFATNASAILRRERRGVPCHARWFRWPSH